MSSKYIEKRIIERFSDSGRYFSGEYNQTALHNILEAKCKFPLRRHIDHIFYKKRSVQRYLLVRDRFSDYITEPILDMGSRDDTAERIFEKQCTLLDKNNPETRDFDWEKEDLPFKEDSFNTVVCLDTLEHINDIHHVFADLTRVTNKYLVVSVPNCWRKMWKALIIGRDPRASYGIPLEKPKDRHKWFFNTEDAENFFLYQAYKHKLEVVGVVYHSPRTRLWHAIIYPIAVRLFPQRFKNFFVDTVFFVFEKR